MQYSCKTKKLKFHLQEFKVKEGLEAVRGTMWINEIGQAQLLLSTLQCLNAITHFSGKAVVRLTVVYLLMHPCVQIQRARKLLGAKLSALLFDLNELLAS